MQPRFIALLAASIAILATHFFATMLSGGQSTINLAEPTIVASAILQPGEYTIEWNGRGPDVQVSFSQGNKTIAVVPAALQATHNRTNIAVMYHTEESGARALVEIETNRATLLFGVTED
jgi:hypothetical protein